MNLFFLLFLFFFLDWITGWCSAATDSIVQTLGTYCPEVERLFFDATDITDRAIKTLSVTCPKLNYLSIPWCQSVTGEHFLSFPYLAPYLIPSFGGPVECANDLKKIVGRLRYLNLSGGHHLTLPFFLDVLRHCPSLEVLSINDCPSVAEDLFPLNNGFTGLKSLEVSRCMKLIPHIHPILKRLPGLLHLQGLPPIFDLLPFLFLDLWQTLFCFPCSHRPW